MRRSWKEVRVEVPIEHQDAVSNFLFELGAQGLIEETCEHRCTLTAYLEHSDRLFPLERYLAQLGLDAPRCIRVGTLEDRDWQNEWKQLFPPTPVGERLWVHPPWDSEVPSDRLSVCIDPGMAFGTGQHPTTLGCLRLIEAAVGSSEVQRALDLGTGSGILAIALARLGVPIVVAADHDPVARAVAEENVRRNGVQQQVRVGERWREEGPYDLVVANLYADILCEFARELSDLCASKAHLIVSGYLTMDRARVESAYSLYGWSVVNTLRDDDWVTQFLAR